MTARYREKLYCVIVCALLSYILFWPVSHASSGQQEECARRGEAFLLQNDSLNILKDREYFFVLKETIDRAKNDIVMSFFRFKTDGKVDNLPNAIVASLGEAAQRGVKVLVLLEQNNDALDGTDKENRQTLEKLKKMGVSVYLDSPQRVLHAKVAVIDGKYTFIGSHNLTQAALKYNNEVSVMIESPHIAAETLGYIKKLMPGGRYRVY